MWQPIETAPKDQFLLLCGPSGYTTTPMVVTTGRMCSDYHAGRWIDHANDDLTDWGFEPTHWAPLDLPGAQPTPSVPEGLALVNATHFLAVLDREDWRTAKNRAELRAMLAAQPTPSIPEGWRLVPIEPTKEMRDAWDSAPICEDDDAEFRRAYSEMLAAAPEPKP